MVYSVWSCTTAIYLFKETTLLLRPHFGGVVYEVHASSSGYERAGVVVVFSGAGVEERYTPADEVSPESLKSAEQLLGKKRSAFPMFYISFLSLLLFQSLIINPLKLTEFIFW